MFYNLGARSTVTKRQTVEAVQSSNVACFFYMKYDNPGLL